MESSPIALPAPEQVLASAAKYLIEGGDDAAASMLLACQVEAIDIGSPSFSGEQTVYSLRVRLRGPRNVCDALDNHENASGKLIRRALRAALPHDTWLDDVAIRAEMPTLGPDWHTELLELVRGKGITNQAAGADNTRVWSGLRFRSATEIRIAAGFDQAKVLFFPLPRARVNGKHGRRNLEPDFLVCHNGKWGILEVDGEPYHPATRTVHDHERDRLFQAHGIRLIQHYDSEICFETPDRVVAEFLGLLDRAY